MKPAEDVALEVLTDLNITCTQADPCDGCSWSSRCGCYREVVAEALAQARREGYLAGQERMRERAARRVEQRGDETGSGPHEAMGYAHGWAIRALPLEEP